MMKPTSTCERCNRKKEWASRRVCSECLDDWQKKSFSAVDFDTWIKNGKYKRERDVDQYETDLKYMDMEEWVKSQGALEPEVVIEPAFIAVCVNAAGISFLKEGGRYEFESGDDEEFIEVKVEGERHPVFKERFRIESV